MAIREKMIYVIDLVTDGANKGLASFRTRLSEADTSAGKFKVGASEAMNQVKAHAATLAMAGGAALVTFGAKAVQAFQEGALEAGKFAQATGLSNEAASRWIEIAGDIGIESSNLESAFGRFNRVLGETPDKVAELGVEVVKTKDGLVDTNATLANAIGRLGEIKDPTERAAVAQQLFGRSWQNMAELVGMSAEDLKESLAGVADAQVFDDEEVAKARELRAAWDDLSDKIDAFVLLVGSELVPRLAVAADKISQVADVIGDVAGAVEEFTGKVDGVLDKMGPLGDGIKKVGGYLVPIKGQFDLAGDAVGFFSDKLGLGGDETGFFTGRLQELTPALEAAAAAVADDLTTAFEEYVPQVGHASEAERDYIDSLVDANEAGKDAQRVLEGTNWYIRKQADDAENASREIVGLRDAHAQLRAELADQSAYLDLQDAFDNVQQAATEAYTAASEGADDAEQKARDHERAQIDLKNKVLDYIDALGNIPPEVASDILALIDEGQLAAVEEKLAWLSRDRFAAVKIRLSGGTLTNDGGISFGGGVTAFDDGGVVGGPRGAPQLILAHGGETVLPTHKTDGKAPAGVIDYDRMAAALVRALQASPLTVTPQAAAGIVSVGMSSARYGQ